MKLNVADVGLSESKAKDFIDAKYHLLDRLDDLESVVQLNQLQNEEAQLKVCVVLILLCCGTCRALITQILVL